MKIPSIEPLEARIAPAVLTIAGPVSASEPDSGQTDFTFKVLLDVPSPIPLTVKVSTLDGTATAADNDFSALTGFVVSIPANTLEKTFTVKVNGDTKFERDETFSVVLSEPSSGHSLGTASSAVGTILNGSDAMPKLSIAPASAVEKNIGTQQMKFTVSLTNASSEVITFNWSTLELPAGGGSATAGVDFTAVSGATGTINPGQTTVDLFVEITPDTVKEQNELFEIQGGSASMGGSPLQFVIDKNRATGTILNDEPDVTLEFAAGQSPRPNEGSGGGETTVNYAIKLNVAASQDIEVFVSTLPGTASAGTDFTAIVNQRFVVQAGQTTIPIPVKVMADSIFENDETFSLQINDVKMNGETIAFPLAPLSVEILNDEATPTLSVKAATTVEPLAETKLMNFTVQLSGAADRDVTFTWNTVQLSGADAATAAADFTGVVATTVTIAAGQTSVQLPVTILSDSVAEGNETFRVDLSNPSLGTLAVGGSEALGTIRQDSLGISVIAPAGPITEGTTGADRDALFRISRGETDSLADTVVVRVSTVNGTATATVGAVTGDFDGLTGAVFTIPAGIKDIVVPVKVKPDNRKEVNETFSLRIDSLEIGGASFDGIATGSASATINDDDNEPTISVGDATVSEGNTGVKKLSFVVTLSNAADTDITFDYVTILDTGANAASGSDFTQVLTPVTVTIPAGATSKSVDIDITGDLVKELSETFSVSISNAMRGATALTITDASGLMTITDDEPVISIAAPVATVEGSSTDGRTNFTFTINLDKSAPENIAVRISTLDGSATAGADYEATGIATEKWIIIPAGARSGSVVVPVLHDLLAEQSESFSVQVNEVKAGVGATLDSNGLPTGGAVLPQDPITPAVATITDDDAIALSISDATIIEGNSGTSQLSFTVSIPLAASRDVTFDYSTAPNTAVGGQDFTAISGMVGTIPAGSKSVTITVDILGDTATEADESFTVVLSNGKVGADSMMIADQFGVGTLLNDEQFVSINSALTVAENISGGLALMTVSLSSVSTSPVTVTLSLTNGTATKGSDFLDPTSLTVTIPAGQTSVTVPVPVTNDTIFEADETFDVYLIGVTNAQLGSGTRGTVTITNDDVASKLTITPTSVSEGTGGTDELPEFTNMTFTVTLDKAAGQPVTFNWQTLSGLPYTATPGDDFTSVALNTVTIAANATSTTFVVKVKKDAIHESNETVGVLISDVAGAELQSPDTVGGTSRTVSGTIINDEGVPTVSIADVRQLEGDSGTSLMEFVVSLSRKADKDVTFLWRTALGGGNPGTEGVDYVPVNVGTLVTIPAGSTSVTLSGISLIGDTLVEADETFLVQVVDPRLDNIPMAGGDLEAVGTIRNDEITASIQTTVSTMEGDGLVEVLIPVTLSQAVPVGQTVTVAYELVTGTTVSHAVSGTDFEIPSPLTVVFAAGETTKNIVIKVKPDAISELNETFIVRLKDGTSQNVKVTTGVNDESTVTIADNDAAPEISVANVGVIESAGTIQFTIKLNRAASSPVTVKAETIEGTAISTGALADFTARGLETITFAPGETSKSYAVTIRNDADTTEGVENFLVRLSEATVGTLAGGGATLDATGSIADADVGSIKISNVSRLEGSTQGTPAKMVFTVVRTGSSAKAVTADYAITFDAVTGAGVTAAEADDILALTGSVTIPAGQSSATIEVSLNGDSVAEGDEAFRISLSNVVNAFVVADADKSATGTILEDDVTVRFRNGGDLARPTVISKAEGNAGSSDMEFFVDLNQAATTDVVVTFAVASGTAESGSDFTVPTTLTITILAGATSGSLLVPITGDMVGELAETFTVNITNVTGGFADTAHNSRTGEITNDDGIFRLLDGARVIEGNNGTSNLVFQIELTDAVFSVGTEYSVDYTTSNITAIAGQDYTATSGTLTFTANGILTVTVPVIGDTASENDETLNLTISNAKLNAQTVTAILKSSATGTIQDDEFNVSIGNALVTEGDAGQQQMIFVVSMPIAASHPVVINYITVDGTATGAAPGATDLSGKDYRAVTNGTLTIPAGERTAQISIPIFGDLVDEPGGETFKVKLTQVTGAIAVADQGTGTIAEDSDPAPTLSIADAQVVEGNSGTPVMKFRVALSEVANADVTFKWNTAAGTAGASDFTALANQTGTIPVGTKFVDIEVPITPDTVVEGNEKFSVTISDAKRGVGAIVISDAAADGTIQDDDGILRIKAGDSAVAIAESGAKARVNLQIEPIPGEFTVTYTITAPTGAGDVAARAGTDYTAPATLTKTFAAGSAPADLFIEVDITDDAADEWNEKFVITLTGVTGATLDATAENLKSVVTITDNDAAPEIQISDISVQESTSAAQFVVRLVGNVTERDITIKWDAVSDTALAGSDFSDLTNQTLTIAAGQREGIISVGILNDTLDEADEKFRVALLEANFTQGTTIADALAFAGGKRVGIATIPQNDLRVATVLNASVVEGATGATTTLNFTIRLDAAPSSTPVKVNYTTVAGTAFAADDFTAATGQVIFQPGETSKLVPISIVADNIAELDETFKLQISIPADGFAALSGNAEATGTIEADEAVFKLERFLANGESEAVTEGGKAKFKVVRTGAADFPAVVSYAAIEDATAAAGMKAVAGNDFVAKTGQISFAAGEDDSSDFNQFIEISVVNDTVAELDGEKFLVRLTNVINGVVSATDGEKPVTINDNDVPPDPFVRIENAFVREGGNLSFVVKLVNSSGVSTNAAYPIKVTFQAVLGTAGAGVAGLDDFPAAFSTAVSTIDFAVGQSQVTISIPTAQDAVAEQEETMTVHLSKVEKNFGGLVEIMNPFLPLGATSPASAAIDATGTIRNDDTVITVNPVSQPEGNAALSDMTFVATIPAAVTFPVTFHYKTKNGTANATDFDSAEGDVVIVAGATQATFVVKVKGDAIREVNETFTVELSAAVNGVLAGASAAETAVVVGTIQNDDAGPQLTISAGQVGEGAAGSPNTELVFTVSLTGEITSNVSVNFATSDGTALSSGVIQDYIGQNGIITFSPLAGIGSQTREIKVKVKGDQWQEGDETVNVTMTNATGDAQIVVASATGTILDEGDSTIGVFLKDTSVVEGGAAAFTLELTSLAAGSFSFTANTRNGSADSSDFVSQTNRQVTINGAASKTATVTVSTRADTLFEASENFHLDLSGLPAGFGFVSGAASAQAVIYNDDQRIISSREFEFIDEDGDLVNIKVSKGALFRANAFGVLQSRGIVTLDPAGTVGGKSISSISFLGTGREFEGANLTVSRKAQAGFDKVTDGRVNVGEVISATTAFGSFQQFAVLQQGVNLGSVKIDGDLGRIITGSTLQPTSIAKLDVRSLGVVERSGDVATQSIFFGKAGSVKVRGDVEGSMYFVGTTVNIANGAAQGLGAVGSLIIDGKVIGGTADQSGFISSNSKFGKISVGGIVGGVGVDSGKIQATTSIGSLNALGDVEGGDGVGSGQVIGQSIGKVEFGKAAKRGVAAVKAGIIGGNAGPDPDLPASQILAQVGSGAVVSFSTIKSVNMVGDIRGGVGENSGMIFANGNVAKMTIGDLVGGDGESSGRVRVFGSVNSFTAGTIQGANASNAGSVQVNGKLSQVKLANLIGAGSESNSGSPIQRAGSILAGDIGSVLVTGDIKAGTATGADQFGGASIFSADSISSLTVKGSVEGNDVTGGIRAVVLSAVNKIGSININALKFAEILAGYSAGETKRGTLSNADAQIGSVVIGSFVGSSIVAGARAGGDDQFGTEDDFAPATGVINSARLISRIASVTIKSISGDGFTSNSGIVAQDVGTVKVGGARVVFGPDAPVEIGVGTNVFVNEV